jgi:uncharacterized protein DUF6444
MDDETPVSPEVGERIPAEAQAYIGALETRGGARQETVQSWQAASQPAEATVHRWRASLQQHSRTSSRPPSSDPSQAWAEPVAEARASVQAQPSAAVDETGGRERRPRAWMWGVVTARGAVLVIRLSRRGQVARALLGERCWGGWSRIAGARITGIPPGGASSAGSICCGISPP